MINNYTFELERDADGHWEISWPQAQTDAYGMQAVLNGGDAERVGDCWSRPNQADYDHARFTWVIAHMAGVLPQPLGARSAEEVLRDIRGSRTAVQNAPSSEVE